MATARLEAFLGLNTKEFEKGLARARKGANDFAETGLKVIAAAATAAGVALAAGTRRAFDLGTQFSVLAGQTGASIDNMVIMRRMFQDAGINIDLMGSSLSKLQLRLGQANQGMTEPIQAFRALGLELDQLNRLSADELFFAVGRALAEMENPALKAFAAMKLFEESGAQLLGMFSNATAFEDAKTAVGDMAGTMKDFADTFFQIDSILDGLPDKSDQFFVGFASRIGPQIIGPLGELNEMDFTRLGERLGSAVAPVIEAFKGGEIWDVFLIEGGQALLRFVGMAGDVMGEVVALLNAGISATFQANAAKLRGMFNPGGFPILGAASLAARVLPDPATTTFSSAFAESMANQPQSNLRENLPGMLDGLQNRTMEPARQRAYRNTAESMLFGTPGSAAAESAAADKALAEKNAANLQRIRETLEYALGQVEIHP